MSASSPQRPAGLFVGLAASLVAVSCGAPAPRSVPREPLLGPAAGRAPVGTGGARWRYHPREAARVYASLALPGGALLTAGANGERWELDPKSGRAEAAAGLAPEELRVIVPLDERWGFVGASGAVYEAPEPLSPFDTASAPPEPLAVLAVAGSALLGVTRGGALLRSEASVGLWDRVGPSEIRWAALAMDGARGLALAVPEAVFVTADGGRTWAPLAAPTVGAIRVARVHPPLVESVLGLRSLPDGALAPPRAGPAEPAPPLEVRPPLAPDAGALAEGDAALDGDRYLEVACVDEGVRSRACERPASGRGAARLVLLDGPFDGRLAQRPLADVGECHAPRLAAHGTSLWLACFRAQPGGAAAPVELLHSADDGASWRAEPQRHFAKAPVLRLAAGPAGALVATGICPTRLADRGCDPRGVVHRRPAPLGEPATRRAGVVTHVLAPSSTPSIDGPALALAFAADGRTAVAVGRRTKGARLGVFVSADAGASFAVHELEEPVGAPEVDLEPPSRWDWRRRTRTVAPTATVGAAADGTFGVTVRDAHGLRLVTVTPDGIGSVAPAPPGANLAAASGTRALAIAGPSGRAFESLDGGASWATLGRVPTNPCGPDPGCSVPLVCGEPGCTFGSELSRVGWEGREVSALDPQIPTFSVERRAAARSRTPLVCTVDASVWGDAGARGEPPGAAEAAIGAADWFAVALDPATAAVTLVEAPGGKRARVERTPLLPPVVGGAPVALATSIQIEGAAALRFPVGAGPAGVVEVAWRNLLEATGGAARVAGAIPERRPNPWHGPPALPGARVHPAAGRLGIASGGLYVRPGPSPKDAWYFTDGKVTERVPPIVWPAVEAGSLPLRDELVRVEGRHVPLRWVGRAEAVLRGRSSDGTWRFDAVTTAPFEARAFGLEPWRSLVYLGSQPAVHVVLGGAAAGASASYVLPLRADGAVTEPARPAPRVGELADPPRPCTAEERARTPRYVVPPEAGAGHPVVVVDERGAVRGLRTAGAVLHGTAEAPCLAALEARPARAAAAGEASADAALIFPGRLEASWVFRLAAESGRREARIEHHALVCRWEPGATLPPELAGAASGE
ncbi:MAG: hypothetical protein IT376_05320 [Polyangiaceae bacterium]|nr:hypothetical protein [Polyangiaceae bacterium]